MGAAVRTDPTQIRVGPLAESERCPLARHVRRNLRRRGAPIDFLCVYSTEPCRNDLLPDPIDVEAHDGPGRKRTPLGTLSYMPALFGLRIAEEVIRRLIAERP